MAKTVWSRVGALGLGLGIMVGGALASPTAATAEGTPATAAQALACNPVGGVPFKSGSTVRANYSTSGCAAGWSFKFHLQRERAWGWETLQQTSFTGARSGALSASCAGEGTYTYVMYHQSVSPVDVVTNRYSGTTRFTC